MLQCASKSCHAYINSSRHTCLFDQNDFTTLKSISVVLQYDKYGDNPWTTSTRTIWDCEIVSSTSSSTGGWHYLLLHDIKIDYTGRAQEVVNNIVTNDHNTMCFEIDKHLAISMHMCLNSHAHAMLTQNNHNYYPQLLQVLSLRTCYLLQFPPPMLSICQPAMLQSVILKLPVILLQSLLIHCNIPEWLPHQLLP